MSDLWSSRLRSLPWAPLARYPTLALGDTVVLDVRRHPITLFSPGLRVIAGLTVLWTDVATPWMLLLFVLSVVTWSRARFPSALKRSLLLAVLLTLPLLIASGIGAVVVTVVLALWFLEDVADWYTDRLVVSRKRIYRLYGVLTKHSPSMALTAITFIDVEETPLGRFLRYGTVKLDSVAQRDEPLSRFERLPEAQFVHVKILELRTAAMPQYPTPGIPL